jgi:hypothetical protein
MAEHDTIGGREVRGYINQLKASAKEAQIKEAELRARRNKAQNRPATEGYNAAPKFPTADRENNVSAGSVGQRRCRLSACLDDWA